MKIYNLLCESDYENEDVHSFISSFRNFEDAKKCMEKAVQDEIREGHYTENELNNIIKRDGDDYVCMYYPNSSDWMFRATIYETELN